MSVFACRCVCLTLSMCLFAHECVFACVFVIYCRSACSFTRMRVNIPNFHPLHHTGNLEMTLASRLSTQANLGNMDTRSSLIKMVAGNMALIQLQAIGVGFLASLTAMVFGWIPEGGWNMLHGMLLCASAILTASVASFGMIRCLTVCPRRN